MKDIEEVVIDTIKKEGLDLEFVSIKYSDEEDSYNIGSAYFYEYSF